MAKQKIKAGSAYVEIGIRNRISQGAKGVQNDLDRLGKRVTALGGIIGGLGVAMASPFAKAIQLASDMEETMGKFSVVFGESADQMRAWSDETANAMGVSQRAMAGMLSGMQDLLVPMGVAPESASEMSQTLSQLSVDLASFNNMDSAKTFEDLMAAMTGSGEVMKKYGVILSEAAVKQELLSMGLDPSAVDNAAKAQARLNIIMRDTTAAQGDAVRTSGSLANQMKSLWASVENAAGAIGGVFVNDLANLTDAINDSVSGLTEWVKENQSLVFAAGAASAGLVGLGGGLIAVGVASQLAAVGIGTVASVSGAVIGTMKSLAAVTTAVKAVTLATAGVFAVASGASTGMAAGIALVNAAYAVSPAVAGFAVAAWGAVGATLTALTAPAALAAIMAGLLGTAWTAAAAAVGSAWAVITGPLLPFIAAGGAAVAVIGALVGVAGYAAIAGMDFGKAWGIAKDTLGAIAGTVKDTFDVIRSALGSGDYSIAAQALWLGVQAVFWDGVSGAMDAFKWLWDEAWATGNRFFKALLDTAWKAAKALASAIMNPFQAAKDIGTLIGELFSSATSFNVDGRARSAKEELAALRESLAVQKERNKVDADGKPEKTKAEKMQVLEDQRNAGVITDAEFEAGKQKLEETDAFLDKVAAIEMEILALEKGEDAAERKRLADEGLTATQIEQIEVLKAKKKAIEEAQEAEKKAAQQRVEGIFGRGQKLSEQGVAPDEVFKRVMSQINRAERTGNIDSETATGARETARGNLDDRMDALRAEGKALADALRTPAEILSNKLANISRLQDQGVITDQTAERAEDKARREFREEQEKNTKKAEQINTDLEQEQRRTGPSATFSAQAAAIIGMGGRTESPELKAMRATAKNTQVIAKNSKKPQIARFG